MRIKIDRRIYDDTVISKTVYRLSGECCIERHLLDDDMESLSVTSADGHRDDESLETEFLRILNDFKLRQIIADETRDIKTILYAKAFAEDETLSEEDIHD